MKRHHLRSTWRLQYLRISFALTRVIHLPKHYLIKYGLKFDLLLYEFMEANVPVSKLHSNCPFTLQ